MKKRKKFDSCKICGTSLCDDEKTKGICEGCLIDKDIPIYEVTCICNTLVEVKEHSIGECPNCNRQIDDRGVIQ